MLLADDSGVTRGRVRAFLEREGFDIVGEAANGHEAVELVRMLDPDVAILDVAMPRLGGLEAARDIHRDCPRTHLILLTHYTDEHVIVIALRSGVRGYVVKQAISEDLVPAIAHVSGGGIFVSPGIAPRGQEPC